jgi:glycosyltransferase involved in cell wall biosynthesis
MNMDYSVILPAYNEATSIERAVRETAAVFDPLKKEYEIIVVDDGSRDDTAAIAASLAAEIPAVRLLRHAANSGKGTAVRTGVMNAQGENILFLDCDLATHPREAPAFIAKMGESDIVIGSRRHADSIIAMSQPWYRVLYGRAINFLIRHLVKLPYHDTQCGFKMFRAEAAKDIFGELGPARWTFDVELLLRARSNGYKIIELPVTWTNGKTSRVRAGEVIPDLFYLWRLKKKMDKKS